MFFWQLAQLQNAITTQVQHAITAKFKLLVWAFARAVNLSTNPRTLLAFLLLRIRKNLVSLQPMVINGDQRVFPAGKGGPGPQKFG